MRVDLCLIPLFFRDMLLTKMLTRAAFIDDPGVRYHIVWAIMKSVPIVYELLRRVWRPSDPYSITTRSTGLPVFASIVAL